MRKYFDIILIGLLCINLYRIFTNYSPETELFGTTTIPTWIAVAVQVLCVLILGYKVYRDYATEKQV